jgi:hypothetical protein
MHTLVADAARKDFRKTRMQWRAGCLSMLLASQGAGVASAMVDLDLQVTALFCFGGLLCTNGVWALGNSYIKLKRASTHEGLEKYFQEVYRNDLAGDDQEV